MEQQVGVVTIGQAPRFDVTPELDALLEHDVCLVESGALDGLRMDQIADLAPRQGDYVLETRLVDGTVVHVCERCVTPLVRQKVTNFWARGISIILLLCTGEFPIFPTEGLLLRPQEIVFHSVDAVARDRKLGILIPSEEQLPQTIARWRVVSEAILPLTVSPYQNQNEVAVAMEEVGRRLAEWNAEIIVMDCIGYSIAMKRTIKAIVKCPVFCARSLVARCLAEVL